MINARRALLLKPSRYLCAEQKPHSKRWKSMLLARSPCCWRVSRRASPRASGCIRATLRVVPPTPVMMAMTLMVSPKPASCRAPQMTLASITHLGGQEVNDLRSGFKRHVGSACYVNEYTGRTRNVNVEQEWMVECFVNHFFGTTVGFTVKHHGDAAVGHDGPNVSESPG